MPPGSGGLRFSLPPGPPCVGSCYGASSSRSEAAMSQDEDPPLLPGDAGSNSVSITIRDVVENVGGVPAAGDVQIEPQPCRDGAIPMVREQLRAVAGDLFMPVAVPIGPYHEGADSCKRTQEKERAVCKLEQCGVNISGLKQVLDGVQSRARGYYTHLPEKHAMAMDPQQFGSMLLHDGCYLLSLFLEYGCAQPTGPGAGGAPGRTGGVSDNTVARDTLYLLENQLPLFVIEEIFNYARAAEEKKSAIECIAQAMEKQLQTQLYISRAPRVAPSTASHLLDLVYSYFAATSTQHQQQTSMALGGPRTGRWRRATEYRRDANLQFKPRAFGPAEEWTILAVHLKKGTLSMPLLRVDPNTLTLLRNLMALEEDKEARPVTAYCFFVSQVACTAEDVELLQKAKVIEHYMNSDESAAQCLAGLCNEVALEIGSLQRNYLKPTWHRLEKRCSARTHNFRGFFREKYFSNIYYRVAFFVALIFFVCEVLQSIYAVITYHRPNNPH